MTARCLQEKDCFQESREKMEESQGGENVKVVVRVSRSFLNWAECFFFNWAEFFLLSSSCLSSAPLVFHHQSSHITTLLVNIFAYNHRHRRIIKYILSLPANLLKFVGETFEFHGGEARIQNHLQGLPNTFQISSTNDYKYMMKKWEISSRQGLWFMKRWTFRQDRGQKTA